MLKFAPSPIVAASMLLALSVQAQTLHVFPRTPDMALVTVVGVSDDGTIAGTVAYGTSPSRINQLYRWSPNLFEQSPIQSGSFVATAVAASSRTVLARTFVPASGIRAAIWNAGAVTTLPQLPTSIRPPQFLSEEVRVTRITADGSRLFGTYVSRDEMPPQIAGSAAPWTWTESEGYTELPTPISTEPFARHGAIVAASRNGNFVAGHSGPNTVSSYPTVWSRNATGWTLTTLPFPTTPGPIYLNDYFFTPNGVAAISDDGRVALGSVNYTDAANVRRSVYVRWINGQVAHTFESASAPASASSLSMQLSRDGQTALIAAASRTPMFWQPDGSTVLLRDYLAGFGVTFPSDTIFSTLTMSSDARTFSGLVYAPSVGWNTSRPFVVTIPTPATLPALAAFALFAAHRRRSTP